MGTDRAVHEREFRDAGFSCQGSPCGCNARGAVRAVLRRQDAGLLLRREPGELHPALNTTGTSFDAARPVYNQLVEFERGTTKVVPSLAESWTVSDDGKEITFKLRKGVKFHSGVNGFTPTRDFNATTCCFRSSASGSRKTRTTRSPAARMTTSTT